MIDSFDTPSREKLIWTVIYSRMRPLILFLSLASVLVWVPSAWGRSQQEYLKKLSETAEFHQKDEGLLSTIRTVRTAFMERDTDKLASMIRKKKAYVAIKSRIGEAGYYTESQVHFIFDKMFRDLQTRSFEYSPQRDITNLDDGRASFRSEWTYVELGSDKVVTERLHFTFEKEKPGWRISEIKASSK